ncbi:uncharacterized protein B0H18DRAFT_932241 [Fomitopsis serialis]|uniref:uncharacterized protein n=1 Tax=Fomitopsis serialis TaxID=139415 RepID=UPI002007E7FC|nr:uncharacterized protein B0H18DRAFT_932241 [Neoantrodia serialis]KAH9927812.1 hypothetical protein B0H18DRAFT_932241 [Neoantrodia serialis]
MTFSTRLPAEFTSLYRLVLRASAASVLNKGPATGRLRSVWRPGFERAAGVLHHLRGTSLTENERTTLQRWYSAWEVRMDKTLTLLSSSARSRGLAHHVTRNLSQLMWSYDQALKHHTLWNQNIPRPRWKPDLPPNHDQYKPAPIVPGSPMDIRMDVKSRRRQMSAELWYSLGEVIMMAEGRDGLSLGRIKTRKR